MQQSTRTITRLLSGLLLIAAVSGCSRSPGLDFPEIPELAVEEFSPRVQEQILQARDALLAAPRDAGHNFELGRILHAYKLQGPAISCYQRARHLQPDDYAIAYLLGIAQVQSGHDAEATANLRATLALNPDYAPAVLRLVEVLVKTGDPSAAQTLIGDLVADTPDSAWAWHLQAQVQAALGDTEAAIGSYRRAIELYPAFGPAHYALALAYRGRGETELAGTHMVRYRQNPLQTPPYNDPLLQSLDDYDISAQAQVRRAKRLQRQGRPQEALAALQQAIADEPQSLEAHSQLIRLYHRLNDTAGARRHYEAVTAIDPNALMANLEYGSLLAEQGRFADAAAAFEKALTANPGHSPAHTLLGEALEEQQQLSGAETHYRQALESDPTNHRAALLLGRLLMRADRRAEAEPLLEGLAQSGEQERAFNLLRSAEVYQEAGDNGRAMALLEEARIHAEAQGQQHLLGEIVHNMLRWQETP